MKLLTKQLLNRFEKVGRQENEKDPLVICKFFNPCGAGTWYATEYYPEEKNFFGYVSIFGGHEDEWGYFSLDELQNFRGKFGIEIDGKLHVSKNGLGIERDLYFEEKRFSEIKRN